MRPGDQLPTEAELRQMYQVSRTSIRQALGKLSSLGLAEAKVGGGTFIKETDGSQVMDKLIFHTFLNQRSLAEIVEFRHLMEPAVTRLACRKASDEDIRELGHIYQRMEAAEKRLEEFAGLDFLFHMNIAKISRNPYVIKTYEAMDELLLSAFSETVPGYGNQGGWRYHRQIIEAFQHRDSALAGSIMQEHMDHLLQDYGE
ncbi:MAG: FadR family transcriptional regulator [Oscillospiraceae bacterium]|nr:FadR family transcriptional regulator [Oscillospiraceae bacterium]